jgi:hypothetical protein
MERLTKPQILRALEPLASALPAAIGRSFGSWGGAALVLLYEARETTRDVDAITLEAGDSGDLRAAADSFWCASREVVDVGFTLTQGRLWFGRMTAQGDCDTDQLQEGQHAWFRVPRASDARLGLIQIATR